MVGDTDGDDTLTLITDPLMAGNIFQFTRDIAHLLILSRQLQENPFMPMRIQYTTAALSAAPAKPV
ncbi:hypothetical protein GCM10011352_40210 [Marinobacterium zhoushanense]|uniref:Uncharacterized protein n=1 Tax=Marinobacterium zhoushanense TaxID=1679163 RepID=A0ABQ1KWK0_9GAMM|nr:hypothetical protein GCM10011352_40210 [Marinobacterium zhoushanense]